MRHFLAMASTWGLVSAASCSLEAHVVISAEDPATIEFLRSFGDELRFLFITSRVSFGEVGPEAFRSEAVPGLAVEIRRADGEKCERCWHYTTDVGSEPEWPTICARCAENVRAIQAEARPA